ncbi:hypothetical protein [Acinetobacter sp. ANC 4648]|uniref:phage tail tube protein n=1 Tax=Acinetobacter sp. ANC 4648 TaxID=1977875 RepID=UPI000A3417FB|nr:hypothetical protein [Acinetobacter sp. ANC 4648]OTG79410.1 hypothetical protein B9T27_14530 [Acinetobacter sp. ANC 4648]
MSKQYISLQGKFYLAEITNGIAAAMRHIGNVPEFELEIGADVLEHQESTSGQRTTDFLMVKTTSVKFKGQLEEVNPENLEYILSGMKSEVATKTVTDESLGTVKDGEEIQLDGYNLTAVTFKAGATTVDPDKYIVDKVFGTVIFKDVTGLTDPILVSYTTGAVTHTTLASNFDKEYELFFKGVNTANGDSMAVRLWRTKKSPETTFPLIHEDLGKYEISGQALSDVSKGTDATLGLYGHVVTIPKVV